jgi:hypothetical protein
MFFFSIWKLSCQRSNSFSLFQRYGWFKIHEPTCISSMPIPCESGVQSGGTETGGNANLESLCHERDKIEATAEYKATDVGNITSEIVAQKMDNESADPLVYCFLDIFLCITIS